MKRWQDRGEVEDSDEEDLSLGHESQSPEQARKRPRLDDGDLRTRPTSGPVTRQQLESRSRTEGLEETWLLPQAATTYGRKHTSVRQVDGHSQPTNKRSEDGPPLVSTASHSNPRPTEINASRSGTQSQRTSGYDALSQPEPVRPDAEEPSTPQALSRSAGESELSSPLSEREVSPPAVFMFPRVVINARSSNLAATETGLIDNVDQASAAQLAANADAYQSRRALRARTEKQLHPFLYDKTLYQQQWRQRGLRPVHYNISDKRSAEKQDSPYSSEDSESQEPQRRGSSSASRPSPSLLPEASPEPLDVPNAEVSSRSQSGTDDEFPDIEAVIHRQVPKGLPHGRKRRKTLHLPGMGHARNHGSTLASREAPDTIENIFSIPPSPPPTSSDSAAQPATRAKAATFRMPFGTTPAPLPTPQISSDVRPTLDEDTDEEGMEPLLVRSQGSTVSRRLNRPPTVHSSTESSEAPESEHEMDLRRLRRERKRIRGVLPASWLKIDLKAQQRQSSPSAARNRSLSSVSPLLPPPSAVQKGIARRLGGRGSVTQSALKPISISDDSGDDMSDRSLDMSPVPVTRRPQSRPFADRLTIDQSETLDDDHMEGAFVDPMLAGTSSRTGSRKSRTKRQPRITDAFNQVHHQSGDHTEGRISSRQIERLHRPVARTTQPGSGRNKRQRWPAPSLSILDGPMPDAQSVPQFVRLAQRQARRRNDLGRHSPTHKMLRLASRDETKEACAVLSAWREGTIAPRQSPRPPCIGKKQQRLPSPVRNDARAARLERPSTTASGKPGLQQIRLDQFTSLTTPSPNDIQEDDAEPPAALVADHVELPTSKSRPQHQPVRYRNAQIETLEDAFNRNHRAAAFERRVHVLTEDISSRQRRSAWNQSLQLDRFLSNKVNSLNSNFTASVPQTEQEQTFDRENAQIRRLPHRPRKRQAAHLNAEARIYRQPSEPLPIDDQPDVLTPANYEQTATILRELGQYGTKYAIDFDIQPLALGTFFHECTFIGSGDFAASLEMRSRNLDAVTGRMHVHVNGEVLEWGAWTEEVAEGVGRIPSAVSDAFQTLLSSDWQPPHKDDVHIVGSNIEHMLRSVVRYCSKCLAFLDPVDRRSCVQRLQRFVEDLLELPVESCANYAVSTQCLQYAVVIATQILLLADDPMIESGKRGDVDNLLAAAGHKLAGHVLPARLEDLRAFYDDNRHAARRETGIRGTDTTVSALVVLRHCLATSTHLTSSFWSTISNALKTVPNHLNTVAALDKLWYDTFTILPVLEIDALGISQPGSRLSNTLQDWTVLKYVVDRLFELYPATSSVHGSTINDYMRATFTRCFHLILQWGWWRCESILGSIFDFYARRNLAPLHNEESRGSPRFLEELTNKPTLEIQPADRSFHIFLKMLVAGLQGMSKHAAYTEKRIGGIVWRFIPNHGRTYRRDAEVKQADLDALRNHHDLLCTLYFASPPRYRPRIDLLRNLVDHETSHREACRLSVRAWTNVASFQAAAREPVESLLPLTAWYKDLVDTSMLQYRLARTEAEHDFAMAKAQSTAGVTETMLINTISNNQRQIAGTLSETLAGLKKALQAATTLPAAVALLEGSTFWRVFDHFDVSERRLYGAFEESLEVVKTALSVERRFSSRHESQTTSEDSQEYGDSSALHEFAITQQPESTTHKVPDMLHDSVRRLVSNVFGAESAIDDAIAAKIVTVWVKTAEVSVLTGRRTWASFVDGYSQDAWQQLPDSDQKHKFTTYFLACVVEKAGDHLRDMSTSVLNGWLSAIVEREAMLKYQHLLTESLLNCWPDEGMLRNLPFMREPRTGRYSITMPNFRLKRLALISSVLSNIRDDFDAIMRNRPDKLQEFRLTNANMLRHLMQAMKSNYRGLQISNAEHVANADAQGAYVHFVQHVVSFLQQYTTDICRVDPFFTDSAAFPLPATDPTYVVGRLRSYVPKLAESRTQKQLAVFIHAVSERAVVDGQQQYLIDQLCTAMDSTLERDNRTTPTLRHILLTVILPAYVEKALVSACSWIVALPIIEACGRALSSCLYTIEIENAPSVERALGCASAVLAAILQVVEQALAHPGLLGLPHVQKVVHTIFQASQSSMVVCDYLYRCSTASAILWTCMRRLHAYAEQIKSCLSGQAGSIDEETLPQDPAPGSTWPETKSFAQRQVRDAFANDWYAHNGQYFVRRGNASVEVVVLMEDEIDGRETLLTALNEFCETFTSICDVRGRTRHTSAAGNDHMQPVGGVLMV